MKKTNWMPLIAVVSLLIAAVGCAKKEKPAEMEPPAGAVEEPAAEAVEITQAFANLELGADLVELGSVMFSQESDGVRVTAHLVGAPSGTHGLHIHEVGDCSSADFKSAGGHFNPTDAVHGGPEDAERHAGDLGNIVIGEDGAGHLELVSNMISLAGGDNAVVGRAVILHEKADDLVSQPTGAAGARLACGVVVPAGSA